MIAHSRVIALFGGNLAISIIIILSICVCYAAQTVLMHHLCSRIPFIYGIQICPLHAASAQVHLSSPMAGGSICYKDQFEMTCWYPEVTAPGRYLVPSPGWKANGFVLLLDETTYQEERVNSTATKLIVTVTDTYSVNTDVAYSCFLVLADTRSDEESTQQVHVHIMG